MRGIEAVCGRSVTPHPPIAVQWAPPSPSGRGVWKAPCETPLPQREGGARARRAWEGEGLPRRSLSVAATVALLFATPALAQPAGSATQGQAVFADRCASCHTLGAVAQGPNLVGVVGRRAASLPDYPYSDALHASGLTWTPANLDRFLQGPTKLVPGTAMEAVVPSEVERRNLIAYLAAARP